MKLHWPHRNLNRRDREHPFVAFVALAAIVAAVLVIVWLRVALVGTKDVERALALSQPPVAQPAKHRGKSHSRKAEDAAAQSRWATGFSP